MQVIGTSEIIGLDRSRSIGFGNKTNKAAATCVELWLMQARAHMSVKKELVLIEIEELLRGNPS